MKEIMASETAQVEEQLFQRIGSIIESARTHVARSVNTTMVHAYWLIGREIVEVEQGGQVRAAYGEAVLRRLATRLTTQYGKGFSLPTLKRMRQLYVTYPRGSSLGVTPSDEHAASEEKGSTTLSLSSSQGIGSTALSQFAEAGRFPPNLSWSHYLVLLQVRHPLARSFYEVEAVNEHWNVRELERQVASMLFERLARSRDKEQVLLLAKHGQRVTVPADVLKDPLVLEFLELKEQSTWQEGDLEQAIIDRLESFLLELGKGFCFVARQKRFTLDGDHFYVDLVFYNRLLRCFVLLDLKLNKLTHQDLGQMQMYVHYFDRYQRQSWEAPTIGIVLCSEKNDAMVRITLPEDNKQILTAQYQMYLPTEEELRSALILEREQAERELHSIEKEPDHAT